MEGHGYRIQDLRWFSSSLSERSGHCSLAKICEAQMLWSVEDDDKEAEDIWYVDVGSKISCAVRNEVA